MKKAAKGGPVVTLFLVTGVGNKTATLQNLIAGANQHFTENATFQTSRGFFRAIQVYFKLFLGHPAVMTSIGVRILYQNELEVIS